MPDSGVIDFQTALSGDAGPPEDALRQQQIAQLHQEFGNLYFNIVAQAPQQNYSIPTGGVLTTFEVSSMAGSGVLVVFTGFVPEVTPERLELAGFALMRLLNGEE